MPDASRSQILLGDIGGTYSRFAFLAQSGRPERILTFANDSFGSIDEAIASYLAKAETRPDTAVLALAGPVSGQEIALTNRGWRFHLGDLASRLGLSRIHAVNDFEALAWALALLEKNDIRSLGRGARTQSLRGAKVVLGPGTGLGVAALVPAGEGWQAVASECGQSCFSASR